MNGKTLRNSLRGVKRSLSKIWNRIYLPDLSRNYMDSGIPEKQRKYVDDELRLMYDGKTPSHFIALQKAFEPIASSRSEKNGASVRLLDAGCASGYYNEVIAHLVDIDIEYHGTDFNPSMLRMAREKYPGLNFSRMDLRHLAWRDGDFDVVLSGAVIEHIKEWKRAVGEIARVSKEWVVMHRALVCLKGATFTRSERHYDVDVYRTYIREKDLLDEFGSHGFEYISKFAVYDKGHDSDIDIFTYLFRRKR